MKIPLLARLVEWPTERPWTMLTLAGVCAVLAALSTSRLHANGSLAAMFPRHDPAAEAMVHVLDDFPASDELLVLASLPKDAPDPDPRRLTEFGHRLAGAIHQSPEVDQLTDGVFYRPDPDTRRFVEEMIAPNALFYLDDATLRAARRRLTPREIDRQIAQDKAILAAPGPAADALKQIMRLDPLRLHDFIMSRLADQTPFHTYKNGDAFVSPDGRSLLVRVMGVKPPSNLDYSATLTSAVMRLARAANTDGLTLQFTGSYPIAARSAQAIRRDMIASVIGSVLLLQALFLLAYRSPFRLFAMAFGPVGLGILVGFGIYAIFMAGLTPLTGVLGAILAGMGIDYSIQYVSYYESRRLAGEGPRQAARQTAIDMSPAVTAAWATSVVGFVAIGWSRVAALRDFAILGTLGLTGAFVCAALVLPAILMLSDKRATPVDRSRLRFGAGGLLTLLNRRRSTWIVLSLLVAAGAIVVVVRARAGVLPMESDLTVMHPRPSSAINAQYDVARKFGVSPGSLMVYLHAPNPRRLVTLAHEVSDRLASPQARAAGVSGTYGLDKLLPNPRQAAERLKEVSEAKADRVVKDFQRVLADNGFASEPFEGYAEFLRRLLTPRRAPTVGDLAPFRRLAQTVLPARALHGGDATEALELVFVNTPLDQNRAQRDRAIAAVRGALAGLDGATVTGLGVVTHDAEQTIASELPRLIGIAVLIVAVYLAFHFANLADAMLVLLPGAFGMLVTVALLRLLGQKLNLVNLVAAPLLIGIDVDYGIFLVSLCRFKQVRQLEAGELSRRIHPGLHAVVICALATMLGYVSLIWTSVPAERSLGIAAALGVGACLVGVIFLLTPIFFSLARRQ